ncbi:MAG: ribosome-associated ATPase/putative transporter RbbA [Paludisphaera borealis]|uniref:ribosome-associated ATPase/putative transporter RbbA n=1 Tax=Paludisphaera borealis TaxID=1387353 RepID=UPI00284C057B|nr:ribosome-associated ATPase/putative transporter RbbA [Paludisphaera borealis]MDR3623236.1 ribosome-associated ATPase/putative transporter RbbA [Paludisphaera borealis]
MSSTTPPPVATLTAVSHSYDRSTRAIDGVTAEFPAGCMIGLLGPDGVGKSSLMGLVAGAKKIQDGKVVVLGGDMADVQHRRDVCTRIAYMPQGLGKNLYPELSVFENIDFFARLFGLSASERRERISALLEATGLGPFPNRPAGNLSGGMKHKVSLCGALIHEPDLLILDEPTTGVDPLSRQQFWSLIDAIRSARPAMSVLVSTAYMDEARRFDWLMVMDAGRILATGTPEEIQNRTGCDNLEEAFVALLPEEKRGGANKLTIPPRPPATGEPAIVARHLTKRFGDFTAVNDVSFTIERGEIFGFLGSNGCGKSTTMKMLTGLLPASEGEALLFGKTVDAGSLEVRKRVGYMSQSFSLYGELTVAQNLWLHARLFHLPPATMAERIDGLVKRFGLGPYLDHASESLPLGLRQRLSLAVAVVHEPEILILDEPTSGVDPVARDEFWELLIELSRRDGITIFITTHFMNEALRCDRISLMHAGNVLACDAPAALIAARGAPDLETAFIGYIEDAIGESADAQQAGDAREALAKALTSSGPRDAHGSSAPINLGRLLAYTRRETLEILRDPVRLAFAFVGSMVLMLVFGYGITMDVENIRFAELDYDQTPESRGYIEAFSSSRSFQHEPPALTPEEGERRLRSNDVSMVLEVEPNFGRRVKQSHAPEAMATVDGANPFRAETIKQYASGTHTRQLEEVYRSQYEGDTLPLFADVELRFMYNPSFESIYAIAPSVPPMLLILIPAILMSVSIVREKELGSITNFYVTPTTRLDFLIGKQLPYIAIGLINFVVVTALTVFVFGVPIKGSGLSLLGCAFLYVIVTTAVGLLVSGFTSTQVAAVFVTAIVTMLPTTQFSGMLQPVSTLIGAARMIGSLWPTTYYMHASVGAFTKGLGPRLLAFDALALAAFIPVLMLLAVAALRSQET